MNKIALVLAPILGFLLLVPLAAASFVAVVAAPAVAEQTREGRCEAAASIGGTGALPPSGADRRASLTNQPTSIPAGVQALYVAASARFGVPWTLLAGIGMEETDHGRRTATSSAGAQGLMQFLPATFAGFGVDGDGDGRADISNDADSIFSAANYLVASGALNGPDGIRQAVYAYNHAGWYVNDVLYYAAAYTGEDNASNPCVTLDTNPGGGVPVIGTGPASAAVSAALQRIGTPYSWGGGNSKGPTTGICCSPGGQDARNVVGFDCSGLVLYAYAQIGVSLPHLADAITYRSGGQLIPRDFNQMRSGDVIGFSYTPGGRAFHVGIYVGGGHMVNSDGHGVSIATLTTGYYSRLAWHIVRFVN
jgi:NlpC/P60 family/Transglycosylase SLT domain